MSYNSITEYVQFSADETASLGLHAFNATMVGSDVPDITLAVKLTVNANEVNYIFDAKLNAGEGTKATSPLIEAKRMGLGDFDVEGAPQGVNVTLTDNGEYGGGTYYIDVTADETVTKDFKGFVTCTFGDTKTPCTVTINLTVYAMRTVSFDTDGGLAVAEQKIVKGKTATKPATAPTKDGFKFVKWTLDGEEYDFETPVEEDIELMAVWEKLPAPPAPDKPDAPGKPKAPKTGDESNVALWAVMALTLGGGATAVVLKKKHN